MLKAKPSSQSMSIMAMVDLDPKNKDELPIQLQGDDHVTRIGTSLSKVEVETISQRTMLIS